MRLLNILVVDDHEEFRASLSEFLLSQPGVASVTEAENGLEAVQMVAGERPDLVLLDISMPVMTGLEAVGHIKSQSPESKIVLVTIHEEKTYRALGEMLNVDGFVSKKNLKQSLRSVLRQYQRG